MIRRGATNAARARSGPPAMWAGVAEEALGSDIVLPEQFQDIWQHASDVTAERALAVAVLEQAIHDLLVYRFATRRRAQRFYWEAFDWVMAEDRFWPYSFLNLCDNLGVDATAVRAQVLAMPAPSMPLLAKAA